MNFKRLAFPFLLIVYAILLILGYSLYFHLNNFTFAQRLGFTLLCWMPFLSEFAVVAFGILWLYRPARISRILTASMLVAFLVIGGVQFTSYLMYSDFLVADALANVEYMKLVFTLKSILLQSIFLAIAAALVLSLKWSGLKNWTTHQRLACSKVLGYYFLPPMAIGLLLYAAWKPEQEPSFALYDELRTPVEAFVKTAHQFYLQKHENRKFSTNHLQSISPQINTESEFPLVKNWIYKSPLPFPKTKKTKPLNVIVFFVESFSARLTSMYNPALKGITPNIQAFADRSMVLDNYYSHTAATYRGIQGQLCSMFPYHGGENGWDDTIESKKLLITNLKAVPDFLKKKGYHSIFMGSENEEIGGLDNMAKSLLHFDEINCQKNILKLCGDSIHTGQGNSVSDHQLMRALNQRLKKMHPDSSFFISVYNLETHAWLDTHKDSIRYKDGSNNMYNVFHNFDHAFGVFMDYFRQSPLAENTMIIVTADHCYPPLEEFVEIAGEDYSPYFVDRVPFIVYDPSHALPARMDKGIRTSIDFAPTLLHLLEYPNEENHFLGVSVFDTIQKSPDYFAAIGAVPYLIKKKGVIAKAKERDDILTFLRVKEYVDYVESLELENRIWKKH